MRWNYASEAELGIILRSRLNDIEYYICERKIGNTRSIVYVREKGMIVLSGELVAHSRYRVLMLEFLANAVLNRC